MIDERWEEDTLFLVFEEDFRFRPDEDPPPPSEPIQAARLAEPSAASGSQGRSREVRSVGGSPGYKCPPPRRCPECSARLRLRTQLSQVSLLSSVRVPCEPAAHGTCRCAPLALPIPSLRPLAHDPCISRNACGPLPRSPAGCPARTPSSAPTHLSSLGRPVVRGAAEGEQSGVFRAEPGLGRPRAPREHCLATGPRRPRVGVLGSREPEGEPGSRQHLVDGDAERCCGAPAPYAYRIGPGGLGGR